MEIPFFTIGHSNRSIEDFIALLKDARIDLIGDVRTVPRSRANPQFNTDSLPRALTVVGISYQHMPALGGLRGKARTVPRNVNDFWENESFHNYADYAQSEPFHAGFAHLLDEGRKQRCAIMCSEAVWWRCHRRIISDYLIANGKIVFHIMGRGRVEPARLTPGAVVQSDGTITYPAPGRSDS